MILRRLFAAWRTRYERVGCFGGCVYFIGAIGGLFISAWVCEIIVITLLYPPGGYFSDSIRFADNRGNLTNGEAIPLLLILAGCVLYIVLLATWTIGSLFVIDLARKDR